MIITVFLLIYLIVFLCLIVWIVARIRSLEDNIFLRVESGMFGRIELLRKHYGEVWLRMRMVIQGVDARTFVDEGSYWHKIRDLIIDYFSGDNAEGKCSVLHLGLGAGTIPLLVALKAPKINHTVIEIDQALIDVVNEQIGLGDFDSIKLVQGDAFALVKENHVFEDRYNVVIVDVFSDYSSLSNPGTSEIEFVQYYKSLMSEHGMMVFNHPSHAKQAREGAMVLLKLLTDNFEFVEWEEVVDRRRKFRNIVTWVLF